MNVLENLAIATNLDLIPSQFSRNRSASMLNQVSQCISPYDFTTGQPLTSVNLQ